LEGHRHWQEHGQRQDVSREGFYPLNPPKTLQSIYVVLGCFFFAVQRFSDDLELEDAVHTAILTLKEGFEGQMTETNIEIGIVEKSGFRRLEVCLLFSFGFWLGGFFLWWVVVLFWCAFSPFSARLKNS
jgi:hypothetical protein